MSFFILCVVCLIAQVMAFGPGRTMIKSKASSALSMSVFDDAVKNWAETYPEHYKYGWGPTTKAERWNGRHAMFGWVALLATGYAKAHGLLPSADTLLEVKDWGTLAYIYGSGISAERATVLVAHIHFLAYSIFAAVAPLSFQDRLFLAEGEKDEPAAGLIPKLNPGLSKESELLNGRLAMLGLTVTVMVSAVFQIPILDVISQGLGGKIF
eukprot:gene6491-7156_t